MMSWLFPDYTRAVSEKSDALSVSLVVVTSAAARFGISKRRFHRFFRRKSLNALLLLAKSHIPSRVTLLRLKHAIRRSFCVVDPPQTYQCEINGLDFLWISLFLASRKPGGGL
mmetsp:Transcript_4331/g.11883  ORF Transcript_4331/g.11883 Transcript_4331/m.11883 type:complete len:113 (-) Transcript_4331:712-1050(-)